jgi:predicted dehydrogenase
MATCSASHGGGEGRRCRVYCAEGWFELDPAFSYRGLRMRVGRKRGEDQQEVQEVRLREVNHFASEMDHFSDCVLEDKQPWTPGEEGLQDLRIMMKIFEAAHTGKAVRV